MQEVSSELAGCWHAVRGRWPARRQRETERCTCADKVDKEPLVKQPPICISLCAGQRQHRAAEPAAQADAHFCRLCPPVASHLIVSLVSVST